MSTRYTPLSPNYDSLETHDVHLHATHLNLHRNRSTRSPSPQPELTLSTLNTHTNADASHDSPVLGSASKERFNIHFKQANGVFARLRSTLVNLFHKNLGLLLIAGSTLTGTGMMTVVKLLSNQEAAGSNDAPKKPSLPPAELIAARMLITLVVAEAWMWYRNIPYPVLGPPGTRLWLTLRGAAGFFGLFGGYYSVQYISLSDSTVIGFLSPFATAFLGRIILKEPFSRREALAAVCSFLGVILIARPPFLFGRITKTDPSTGIPEHDTAGSADHGIVHDVTSSGTRQAEENERMRLIAICVGLLGVVGASMAYISMRRLKDSIHVMHSIISFTSWCFIISTVSTLLSNVIPGFPETSRIVWHWPDSAQLLGIFAIGFLGFLGQVLLTMGFQKEAAGRGTLALYVAIVFSLISERIFFNHQPDGLSVVGMFIILASAIYVALLKSSTSHEARAQPDTEGDEEVGLMSMDSVSDGDDDERTLRGDEGDRIKWDDVK